MAARVFTVMIVNKKNTSACVNAVGLARRKRINVHVLDAQNAAKRKMTAFVNIATSVQKKSLSVPAVKYSKKRHHTEPTTLDSQKVAHLHGELKDRFISFP